MRVSVIIPTRNRPHDLQTCLRSVLQLAYPDFEVVVVDQSPSDEGQKLALALGDARIRFIRTDTVGRARGANIGVAESTGDVLAFTDDDITVPPNWLTRVTAVFEATPGLGAYFGAVTAPAYDEGDCYIPTFSPKQFRVIRGKNAQEPLDGMGANMAVSRAAVAKAGGFDPLMGVGSSLRSGEDWELAYRILRAGFAIVEDPEVALTHYGARTFANGQVDKLVMSYLFGHGAGYWLNVRRGDVMALLALSKEVAARGWQVATNAVRGRRPVGARRVLYVMYGAWCAALCRRTSSAA